MSSQKADFQNSVLASTFWKVKQAKEVNTHTHTQSVLHNKVNIAWYKTFKRTENYIAAVVSKGSAHLQLAWSSDISFLSERKPCTDVLLMFLAFCERLPKRLHIIFFFLLTRSKHFYLSVTIWFIVTTVLVEPLLISEGFSGQTHKSIVSFTKQKVWAARAKKDRSESLPRLQEFFFLPQSSGISLRRPLERQQLFSAGSFETLVAVNTSGLEGTVTTLIEQPTGEIK